MLIKHPPHRISSQNTIYINSRTPFVSSLVRISRKLKVKNTRQVQVYGAGKAIQKALCVALELKRQGYKVDIYTKTIKVIDETIHESNAEMKERSLPAIELRVAKKTNITAISA